MEPQHHLVPLQGIKHLGVTHRIDEVGAALLRVAHEVGVFFPGVEDDVMVRGNVLAQQEVMRAIQGPHFLTALLAGADVVDIVMQGRPTTDKARHALVRHRGGAKPLHIRALDVVAHVRQHVLYGGVEFLTKAANRVKHGPSKERGEAEAPPPVGYAGTMMFG